jgi:hypothetical protein
MGDHEWSGSLDNETLSESAAGDCLPVAFEFAIKCVPLRLPFV